MSMVVVIDWDGSSDPGVVPVISTVCDRCIGIVSPMWGRIWRSTGCADAMSATSASAATATTRLTLEAIRVVLRGRSNARCQRTRRRLRGDDLPELRREVGLHIRRPGEERCVAGAQNFLFGVQR